MESAYGNAISIFIRLTGPIHDLKNEFSVICKENILVTLFILCMYYESLRCSVSDLCAFRLSLDYLTMLHATICLECHKQLDQPVRL